MERIPAVRIYAEDDTFLAREGLNICFYIRRAHEEIAQSVTLALEMYLQAVGPQALSWYVDEEGDWQELDAMGWSYNWRELRERKALIVELTDSPSNASQYGFDYHGKTLTARWFNNSKDAVCAVAFWLPIEYLEKHGPSGVRQLAIQLASVLPFDSGHAGLAIHSFLSILGVSRTLLPYRERYPGMDLQDFGLTSWTLGMHVRGVSWMNFLGPPVLAALGGAEGLRSRLSTPGTTVQSLDAERAVVTLGEWPEAGDSEQGLSLPAYRELARVLEPWLFHAPLLRDETAADSLRWTRRFLD